MESHHYPKPARGRKKRTHCNCFHVIYGSSSWTRKSFVINYKYIVINDDDDNQPCRRRLETFHRAGFVYASHLFFPFFKWSRDHGADTDVSCEKRAHTRNTRRTHVSGRRADFVRWIISRSSTRDESFTNNFSAGGVKNSREQKCADTGGRLLFHYSRTELACLSESRSSHRTSLSVDA